MLKTLFIILQSYQVLSYLDTLTDSTIDTMRNCMTLKTATPSTSCTTESIAFLNALYSAIDEVKSYSTQIPNKVFPGVAVGVLRLSASSVSDPSAAAIRARMDFTKREGADSWCAGTSTAANEYIQASSPVPMVFSRIELKGRGDVSSYIASFKITYSSDGTTWTNYKSGATFTGATSNTQVFGMALEPFTARAIRIIPVTFVTGICTKLEVLISKASSNKVLAANALIATIACGFNVRSTSSLSTITDVTRVALNVVQPTGSSAFCTEFNDQSNWVMVGSFDLMKWSQVKIQGQASSSNWVTTFKVSYTVDGESWIFYNSGQNLTANTDATTVLTVSLTAFNAIAVRVHPVTWNTATCLRLELFCSEI